MDTTNPLPYFLFIVGKLNRGGFIFMPKKLNIDIVREFVKSNSKCSLVSSEYINSKKKLKFRCKCGNEFETAFDTFKNANQRQCPDCGIELRASSKRANLDKAIKSFSSKGLNLISKEYINARSKLLAKDKDGYKVLISLDNLNGGKTPQRFYQNNPYTIDNIKIWLAKNNCNFEIISTKFISANDNLEFKCSKGHIFSTSWNRIKNQNVGCSICVQSKGEDLISEYLLNQNLLFEREKTFENCKYKKKLRFDFYIDSLNVCIEFQGVQHYKPISHFGGYARYNAQLKKDNIKVEFCKKNNIRLIRIPYFEIDNIDNILKSAL